MMMLGWVFGLLSILPALAVSLKDASSILYDNIKVFRIPTCHNTSKLDTLVSQYQLNRWTGRILPNSHVDLEVPFLKLANFTNAINAILIEDGITQPIITMHEDLGASIRQEIEGAKSLSEMKIRSGGNVASLAWFDSYHSYDDHLTFLDDLVAQYPNNSEIISSGQSLQGRDIKGIHIFGANGAGNNPAIIWHSTVHAREWIATMVTEFLAYSLLSEYGNSSTTAYLDNFDFYVFPIVNPDGFVYSQTTNRLWRKNRQSPPSGSSCYGRDINRNWDVQWSTPGGASTEPCQQTYKGEAPFDAPETVALASFINNLANSTPGAKMFIDWHSYGQLFMSPYGYDCSKTAPDNEELGILATGFITALKNVYGTRFTSGPVCTILYPVTGSAVDYSYDISKIKYAFTAELRDEGDNGFILPPIQIRPSSEEVWAGVKYLLAHIQ